MARRLADWGEVIDAIEALRVAVREARRRDGLTLRDVAERSGVSFNSISRFERGSDIQLSDVAERADLLDLVGGRPLRQREPGGDLVDLSRDHAMAG